MVGQDKYPFLGEVESFGLELVADVQVFSSVDDSRLDDLGQFSLEEFFSEAVTDDRPEELEPQQEMLFHAEIELTAQGFREHRF